jgi:type VI secretion system protein ImpM
MSMFKRKPQKGTEEQQALPRISITGALGKLNSEADFVQIDANWREIKGLDEILQGLYLNLSRSAQKRPFSGCGLLLTGGSDRQGLVSIAYPSADRAGRLYPFVIFNRLSDAGFYYKPEALFVSGLCSIRKGLDHALERGETPNSGWLVSLGALPEHQSYVDFRNAKRNAMSLAEEILLDDFLIAAAGHDQNRRIDFMVGIVLLITALKQGRVHRAYHGIWLPLPLMEKNENVVAFWLQLLSAIMASNQQWRPDVAWTSSVGNSRLFVFTKPLTSTGLQATIDDESAVSGFLGWQDIASSEDAHTRVKQLYSSWQNRKGINLLDVAIEWYQLL